MSNEHASLAADFGSKGETQVDRFTKLIEQRDRRRVTEAEYAKGAEIARIVKRRSQ